MPLVRIGEQLTVAPGDLPPLFRGIGPRLSGFSFFLLQGKVFLQNSVFLIEDHVEPVFIQGCREQVGEKTLILTVQFYAIFLTQLPKLRQKAVPLLPAVAGMGQGDFLLPHAPFHRNSLPRPICRKTVDRFHA